MSTPCEAGPDVQRPLTNLDELRGLLADLFAKGRVEFWTAPSAFGESPVYYAALWAHSSAGHLTRQRAGWSFDESVRALHRAASEVR